MSGDGHEIVAESAEMRVMRYVIAVGVVALGMLWSGCGPEKKDEIIVLHTGRMVGNVYPLNLQGNVPLQHYQYLAGYVKEVRARAAETGAQVILVDSGDSFTGSFASQVTGSQNVATLFNELGYDAIFLGNLDSDIPAGLLKSIKAPVLCPFMNDKGEPAFPGTQFGTALQKGKFKVNLLANFYGDSSMEGQPQRFPMWFGASDAAVAPYRDYATLAQQLNTSEPGVLNLFHWMKFELGAEPPVDYLGKLEGWKMEGILAHRIYSRSKKDTWGQSDFSKWSLPVSENILRRNFGFTLARIDFERTSKGWKAKDSKLVKLTANTAPADAEIVKKIEVFSEPIKNADVTVGQLSSGVTEEQVLKCYMAALSELPGIDTVVYSPESIRAELPRGKLTASTLFAALPWTTDLCQLDLTAEQAESMAKVPDLARLEKSPAGGPRRAVTSRYFAELLRRELGLQPAQVKMLGLGSEYEFFLKFAQKNPDLTAVKFPTEWTYVSP